MNWYGEFADRWERDVPIAHMTWFRLGGPARHLFRPRDVEDLSCFARRASDQGVAWRILGAGANVLVSDDGVDGVVVRLDAPAFRHVERSGRALEVGAGVDLMPFCKRCATEGLTGLECMAGIPATVGGAVRMNAGGKFGEFGSVVTEAKIMDRDGTVRTWSRDHLGFGYRKSNIGDAVVVSATLNLADDDPDRTKRTYDENFAYKMRTQPMAEKSAGCIFKNPTGQSAGALIDRAGLKGARHGGARVSEQHANFILAAKDATASDVLGLIDHVRERVRREFSTELEIEIDIW